MRILRGLVGAVLWILSAVLGLLGLIACLTLILLPVGIPLIGYARRMFFFSIRLMLPRAVAHPVDTAQKSMHEHRRALQKSVAAKKPDIDKARKWSRKKAKRLRKKVPFGS